ncbi:MAG TPA: hypothetical protein VJX16_09640 [Terriglobales bacterium]|nr:hypothetical protein [Terriglobales bacterium]
MSKKPTVADAELILKLYDLRREAEMRKARHWWVVNFWPDSADDLGKIAMAAGTQENNWMRQVTGYWEMAASFVLHGTLSEELFMELAFCGEMFVIYAKVRPFLRDLREQLKSPTIMANIEKLITRSKSARETLKGFEERLAARKKTMKEAAVARAS